MIQEFGKILYLGSNIEVLKILFSDKIFILNPIEEDLISYLICSPDTPYETSLEKIKHWKVHQSLVFLKADDMLLGGKHRKVIKTENMSFIPYDHTSSTMIAASIMGNSLETWNILYDQFKDEMNTFHRSYRVSCFKYQCPTCLIGKYDNCYDCRTYVFIMSKYAAKMKLSIIDTYKKFSELNLV